VIYPAPALYLEDFVKQMCEPVREFDADKERYVWSKGDGQDHFRLADVYEWIAMDLLTGGSNSSIVVTGGEN
jgi:hypothetical protein